MLEVKENLNWKNYFLSNMKCFLNRDCSSLFQSKWRGFWKPPWKYIDGFNYFLNGELLKAKTLNLEPTLAIHNYGKAIERTFIPQKFPALVSFIKLKEDGKIRLKIEVNHRKREENFRIGEKKGSSRIERFEKGETGSYKIKEKEESIMVKGRDRYTLIGSKGGFKFDKIGKYEIYKPLYEKKQRKFVLGELVRQVREGDTIPFFFLCGKKKSKLEEQLSEVRKLKNWRIFQLEKKKARREKLKNFKIQGLNLKTEQHANSLLKLHHEYDTGRGFLAGLPYFTQFWGRDTAWISFGLLDSGRFKEVKQSLETLFRYSKEGRVPTVINGYGKVKYYGFGSTLLTLIALCRYVRYSGDIEFFKSLNKIIEENLEWIRNHQKGEGLIKVKKGKATWMDTLDRKGYPIETQSYLVEALRGLGEIYTSIGNKARGEKLIKESREIREKLDRFWMEDKELFCDRLYKGEQVRELTANPLVLLYFGQVNKKRAEQMLEKYSQPDFMTKKGVRSYSKSSPNYKGSYHRGWVWQLINGIYTCASFQYSKPELGWKMLKKIERDLHNYSIGDISEAFDDKNFANSGSGLQGWSSALVINAIDSFLFGIKPDTLSKRLILEPSPPEKLNRDLKRENKRVGGKRLNINFKKEGGDWSLKTKGLPGWEIEKKV